MVDTKILITGATGYLGGRIYQQLNNEFQIILSSRKKKLPIEYNLNTKVTFFNLQDSDIKEILKDVDVIIHLASMNARECQENILDAYEVNVNNSIRILQNINPSQKTLFIYFSTAHVYNSPLEGYIDESNIPNNTHPYSTTRKTVEDVLKYFSSINICKSLVFRLSNAVGRPLSKETDCWELFCNNLCMNAVKKKNLILSSNGLAQRNFVSIKKILNVILRSIKIKDDLDSFEIFNLGGDSNLSLYGMAELIQEQYNKIYGESIPIILGKEGIEGKPLTFSSMKLSSRFGSFLDPLNEEIEELLKFSHKIF
ncbi:MAG: SDR family oxidoreductase [Leptospiraceae bacterium]|nr:SDR family oxidoreductase [Leptospiraceae bacterium]